MIHASEWAYVCLAIVIASIRQVFAKSASSVWSKWSDRGAVEKILLGAATFGLAHPQRPPGSLTLTGSTALTRPPFAIFMSVCTFSIFSAGLLPFFRSYRDLGPNWRAGRGPLPRHHRGLRARPRHPMYASFFAILFRADAKLVANWVAGWAGLLSLVAMFVLVLLNR